MVSQDVFQTEYKKLNKFQKEAVETLSGPVMVIAGPGTGKTQVIALRIANILKKTDIKSDGILCLTFTNSAVEAMKSRLINYIGEEGKSVNIFTFHSFGMQIIGQHFKVLGLKEPPKLLEDTAAALFFNEVLSQNDWEYLRPRSDSTRYLEDLRSIISLLKRERISAEDLQSAVEKEIKSLKTNDTSLSTRGESKGEFKKEVVNKIEGLERSLEISKFIKIYEDEKKTKNVIDYDDVLENLVKIVEISNDALSQIREKYLYVLVDEHQDSSRVQNEFLKKVWGTVEAPDIFVVGDDRQLIYGFSGASIDHFQSFKKTFHGAKLIALLDNYRSTQIILDVAHVLLQSVFSSEKLVSQRAENHSIRLIEACTPEDEIIAAGLDIKHKELDPNNCVILVPKNRQVRTGLEILHRLGLPVAALDALNLFEQPEALAFIRVLKIIATGDIPSLALSFFDPVAGVGPIEANKFLIGQNMRGFSLDFLLNKKTLSLFKEGTAAEKWLTKLAKWQGDAKKSDVTTFIKTLCVELFSGENKHNLVTGEEISNTILGLLVKELEKNPKLSLVEFVSYLEKLEVYSEHVPIVSTPRQGVKVLTMHSSKGLEFEYVWIAHMDERSLVGTRKMGLTLPESIKEKIEERDIDAVKRKLYVAITRAKRFCTISYATESHKGSAQELAKLIEELPSEVFKKEHAKIESHKESEVQDLPLLAKLVAEKYADRYVSVSLLNNFFECPWKWYFRNILRLPEPPVEILEFGSAVHAGIDRILKSNIISSEDEIQKIASEEISKLNYGSSRDRARMSKDAFVILSKWVRERLKEINSNRKTEESVYMKYNSFPHLKIYGKIDLIENLRTKEVRVTDFKTGGARKKSEIEKLDEDGKMSNYLRQLAMYSFLIKESPQWQATVSESRLEFLEAKNKKESIYSTVIGEKEIDSLKHDIKEYDESIKKGDWVLRPCHYNSYGKNTECEYCKIAEVYKS